MITCPSCNHQNPEGSLQCENCYTPLPATTSCPNCGASVQTDATFCGQCGFNLQAENTPLSASIEETAIGPMPNMSLEEVSLPDEIPLSGGSPDILPETVMSTPIKSPWDDNEDDNQTIAQTQKIPNGFPEVESAPVTSFSSESAETDFADLEQSSTNEVTMPWQSESPDLDPELEEPEELAELSTEPKSASAEEELETFAPEPAESSQTPDPNLVGLGTISGATQLQVQTASLLHLQSNTTIEIAYNLDVVHIGKPNGQIPPDIDVAGFPDSEVVSRIHADIRIEGDAYYIEDVGSSNGTYVNHAPLQQGNRHRLRAGDRIALGKGDLVTFIFQLNS
ncbi:MAG: FHA domain-containing protein [Cyanobacteria bacterium P01_E01_bin.35]